MYHGSPIITLVVLKEEKNGVRPMNIIAPPQRGVLLAQKATHLSYSEHNIGHSVTFLQTTKTSPCLRQAQPKQETNKSLKILPC